MTIQWTDAEKKRQRALMDDEGSTDQCCGSHHWMGCTDEPCCSRCPWRLNEED